MTPPDNTTNRTVDIQNASADAVKENLERMMIQGIAPPCEDIQKNCNVVGPVPAETYTQAALIGANTVPAKTAEDIAPAAGSSHVNLTLIPLNATWDPAASLMVYAYGEPVVVNATLVNNGSDPITIMGYPPKAGIHYRNANPFRTFGRSHQTLVLEPGQSLSSPVTWDQKDAGGSQVDPGRYTVAVYYLFNESASGSWDESHLDTVSSSTDVMILPKGGAYQGTIAVNESLTKENITATLESVSFSNASWTASVLFRFPDKESYDLMSTCNRSWLEYWSIARYGADYSLDAATPRTFFDTSADCGLPGAERFVFTGEPVPAGAQNISLNITTDWMDPSCQTLPPHTWNYRVNLNAPQSPPDLTLAPASTRLATPLPVALPYLATGLAVAMYAVVRSRRRS
jgi:hypothetical protein